MSDGSKRFLVSLSFPGEHREFVGEVAAVLAQAFTQERILYDKFHDAEFARTDLDVYLPGLYRTQSELIVILLCPDYVAKRWCKLEWRHIRQLIATVEEGRIMFLSFGNPGDLSTFGVLGGDGYIDVLSLTPQAAAEKIVKRLHINQTITSSATLSNSDASAIRRRLVEAKTHRELQPLLFQAQALVQTPEIRLLIADIERAIEKTLITLANEPSPVIYPSRLRHGAENLIGREAELQHLDEAWNNPAIHLLVIVAWGGVGKTSLVSHWQAELAQRGYDGASYFDWSFYSQGTKDQSSVSSDHFINQALEFFRNLGDTRALPQSAWDKGARLAEWVAQRRTLLVLDGLEPLQYPPGLMAGHLKDPAMQALLKGLAGKNPGLCIITTRAPIPELDPYVGKTVAYFGQKEHLADRHPKLCSLSISAGVKLLHTLGVRGTLTEVEQLVKDVQGHALTLHLLGAYLTEAHGGDIRCRDRVSLEQADYESRTSEDRAYGHAFRVMEAYEKWLEGGLKRNQCQLTILRLTGFFDRPADPASLAVLLDKSPIADIAKVPGNFTEADWNIAVAGLVKLGLVRTMLWEPSLVKGFSEEQAKTPPNMRGEPADFPQTIRLGVCGGTVLDAHPLLRQYFANRIRAQYPDIWTAGHQCLCLHLSKSVPYWPEGLEGLQPLYQAVAHACQAGLYDDALNIYRRSILRGIQGPDAFYSTGKLGAISADLAVLTCFFDTPWKCVTTALPERRRAWLLNDTGWHLMAIGRLVEALEPLKSALDLREKNEKWEFATGVAFNLSDLELTLGNLDAAERYARKAVDLADRSRDVLQRAEYQAALADILHQKGQRSKAHEYFSDAEALEATKLPESPLLHSRQGLWFCDLLLAESEQASWQKALGLDVQGQRTEWESFCLKVEARASWTLRLDKVNRSGLVVLALEHLTLGRVVLYQSLLETSEPRRSEMLEAARKLITRAVDGLRAAGTIHELPRGLLIRAWLRRLTGTYTGPESAQADLDEAWEIAERGPMRLHMADIHLYRARLFGMRIAECGMRNGGGGGRNETEKYPWESPQADLAAARKMIESCGYWRRKEELEDAEKAILS